MASFNCAPVHIVYNQYTDGSHEAWQFSQIRSQERETTLHVQLQEQPEERLADASSSSSSPPRKGVSGWSW
jgi:hypothetical protein